MTHKLMGLVVVLFLLPDAQVQIALLIGNSIVHLASRCALYLTRAALIVTAPPVTRAALAFATPIASRGTQAWLYAKAALRTNKAKRIRTSELAGHLFPRHIREAAWEPAINERLEDTFALRGKYRRRKWACRWIDFCFWLNFALTFLLTLRVWVVDSLVKLVPEGWRAWR